MISLISIFDFYTFFFNFRTWFTPYLELELDPDLGLALGVVLESFAVLLNDFDSYDFA